MFHRWPTAAVVLLNFVILTIFASPALCQSLQIDSVSLNDVIKEWNYAHNARSRQSFERIYDDQLIFYTEVSSREKAIKAKEQMFGKYKDFHQRIVPPIKHIAYSTGVIKSDFVKRVTRNGKTSDFPSYLLISYTDGNYKVVGESDHPSDKTLGFKLSIGEPIKIDFEDTQVEGVAAEEEDTILAGAEAALDQSLDEVESLQSRLMSETVAIPKLYLYYLLGLLIIGGLAILIAKVPKPKKRTKTKRKEVVRKGETRDEGVDEYVLSLFDPLYFKAKRARPVVTVMNGGDQNADSFSGYEFEFEQKDKRVLFSVDFSFIPAAENGKIQVATPAQLRSYQQYEVEKDRDVYILLGLSGKPSEPQELYLIPLKEIKKQWFSYEELQEFRKYGMFFYNLQRGRLL